MKRNLMISVRFNRDEWMKLVRVAAMRNVTVSQVIRDAVARINEPQGYK